MERITAFKDVDGRLWEKPEEAFVSDVFSALEMKYEPFEEGKPYDETPIHTQIGFELKLRKAILLARSGTLTETKPGVRTGTEIDTTRLGPPGSPLPLRQADGHRVVRMATDIPAGDPIPDPYLATA